MVRFKMVSNPTPVRYSLWALYHRLGTFGHHRGAVDIQRLATLRGAAVLWLDE